MALSRPILYMVEASPAVRAVLMTAKAIGLTLVKKRVSLLKGEHMTEEYLKMNPQHTVPVLKDDGFVLSESHAIMPYLVEKYAADDWLYPMDVRKKALVNQRLHFNNAIMYSRLLKMFLPILYKKKTTIEDVDKERMNEIYRLLNTFLDNSKWFAGDSVTVADFAFYATVSSANVWIPISDNYHPNVKSWKQTMETEMPLTVEVNKPGLEEYTNFYKTLLSDYQ